MKVVGYVSEANPFFDKKAWSGTVYMLRMAIEEAGYAVVWIPVEPNRKLYVFFEKLYRKFKCTLFDHTYIYFWLCARSIDKKSIKQIDYLFFPGGCQITKYLKIQVPIIYLSDATFGRLINYYWWNVPKWNEVQGNALERYAIRHSDIRIYSSEWSRQSAINDYGASPQNTHVVEFGANINDDYIRVSPIYNSGDQLRILFSGVDWKRKGADIAIKTVSILRNSGINVKLILVGLPIYVIPESYRNIEYVEYIGFLDKNIEEQGKKYMDILSSCHCLLLPTHAECSAIVFSEASAFGLPIFTYDTGGIANYVINDINGYRLDCDAGEQQFAKIISDCLITNKMPSLQRGALELYKEKLSWKAWSSRFKKIIESY